MLTFACGARHGFSDGGCLQSQGPGYIDNNFLVSDVSIVLEECLEHCLGVCPSDIVFMRELQYKECLLRAGLR